MAALDLDPIFLKAIRLLHSKAKDSTEQLKQLFDDALRPGQETISSLRISVKKPEKSSPKHFNLEVQLSRKPGSKDEDKKKKEPEKRPHEKTKADFDSLLSDTKRPKLESPKTVTHRSPSPLVIKDEDLSSEDNTSATDIALEMGLACVVCRSIEVTSGNTLVECQECHSLYHQVRSCLQWGHSMPSNLISAPYRLRFSRHLECHKPPITDQDVNDPRLVWYCAKCTKNMKKMASKNQKPVKTPSSSGAKEGNVLSKPVKVEPVAPVVQPTHIFKRAEPKVSAGSSTSSATLVSSSSGNSSGKPIGLAGLAASLKSYQNPKPSVATGGKPSLGAKPSGTSTGSSSKSSFSSLLMGSKTSQGGNNSSSSSSSSSATKSSTSAPPERKHSTSAGSGSNSNSGSSSSNTGSGSSSSLMSADKRLQIMKKKAAAKMQEKRRLSVK